MKRHLNILFVYFSLTVLLIANIGIAVNKHICYTEGITEYSLLHSNHCENHMVQNTSSCCKKPQENNAFNKNCCDENIIYAKLNVDYQIFHIQPYKLKTFIITLLHYYHSFNAVSFFTDDHDITIKPPLLPFFYKVNYYLSCLSIFRI